MEWSQILADLASGREQLDSRSESFHDLAVGHRSRIYCEKGCCNCCTLTVNCSYPEALAISRALTPAQQAAVTGKVPTLIAIARQAQNLTEYLRLFRERLGGCPFLTAEDGSCGIYPQRPLSCRALLSTRNSDWCAVDFAALHPLEKEAYLSSLDPELVAFPTHYLGASRKLGQELESRAEEKMLERFGLSLSGNLIYQVWLVQQHLLSEVIGQGIAATRQFLDDRTLTLPYLLQLRKV